MSKARDLSQVVNPTGAEKVGYTPEGTGAVVRDVESKLREFVSVKDFGAVGDGVTDDTLAIQAAINSLPLNTASVGVLSPKGFANGGRIYFPRGRYKVSNTLMLKRGVYLCGESRESSQILSFTPLSVFKYIDLGRYIQDEIKISDLSIWQDSSIVPYSGAGIEVFFDTELQAVASVAVSIENVVIEGTFRGILLGAGGWSTIKNVNVTKCVTYGFHVKFTDTATPPTSISTTSTTFLNCYASMCGADGYRFEAGGYCSLVSAASDSNVGYGYYFDGGVGHTLIGCGAEENASGGVYIKNAYGMTINIFIIDHTTSSHAITTNNSQKVTLLGGSLQSTTSSGYGVFQEVAGQNVVVVGTAFQVNYATNKSNSTFKFLDLTSFGGFVGGISNKWAIGAVQQPEPDATLGVTGVPDTDTNYFIKTYGGFTGAGTVRNAALYAQAGTANTAVTYPLLIGGFFPSATKGAASTVQRCAGLYITQQTVGSTANANLMIDANAGTIPAGNWNVYSDSTRDNYLAGKMTWKPPASGNAANNGDFTILATSNTNLQLQYCGSDGVLRVANLTLA